MKKLLIIICVTIVSCNCLNKKISKETTNINIKDYKTLASFKSDSLLYIQRNFIGEQSEFAGKTINTFLDKLEIPPKSFLVGIGGSPYTTYIGVTLQFFNDVEVEKKVEIKKNPMIMNVYFETPVSSEKMDKLLTETKGNWDEKVVRKYLGDEKIKKIALVDYGF